MCDYLLHCILMSMMISIAGLLGKKKSLTLFHEHSLYHKAYVRLRGNFTDESNRE